MSRTRPNQNDRHENWLGLPDPLPPVATSARLPFRGDGIAAAPSPFTLLHRLGERPAKLRTDVSLCWSSRALHLRASLYTQQIDRVRKLIETPGNYGRDQWGLDALEVQIDVGGKKDEFAHFILPPCGNAVIYRGFNNRHLQGFHPKPSVRVEVDAGRGCWTLHADFPFDDLGGTPAPGDRWGLNLMRVDPDEADGFSQWSPTFGDALRPERFGVIEFVDGPVQPPDDAERIEQYRRHAEAKHALMHETVNSLCAAAALPFLPVKTWADWAAHLRTRATPRPIRWENADLGAGANLPPAIDHPSVLKLAERASGKIASWNPTDPPAESFSPIPYESLVDAFLLTRDERYARDIERWLLTHEAYCQKILATPGRPLGHEHHEIYPDIQVVYAGWIARAYLTLASHGRASEALHAAVMARLLRAGRFACLNIAVNYNYGNHQIFESAGLATLAALFPELPESDRWAAVASRSLAHHYRREVLADGAYAERCGYHTVALTFTAQALAAIVVNGQQKRFPEFMSEDVQATLDRMYQWAASMVLPDGTFPAFGDFRCHSILRMLAQGAALRSLPGVSLPVRRLVPGLASGPAPAPEPAGANASVSHQPSQFTVMRNGHGRESCQMAVEHGPLGGEHSHVDNMGFIAHAYGQPIAVDSAMGLNYNDPHHRRWFRRAEAHNVVTIDQATPEKLASRTAWESTPQSDRLAMRSQAYQHSHGVVHDRVVRFDKRGVWAVFDRLSRPGHAAARPGEYHLHLHTPLDLRPGPAGLLTGENQAAGMGLCVAVFSDVTPAFASERKRSGVPHTSTNYLRQHDELMLHSDALVGETNWLRWSRPADDAGGAWFILLLIPWVGSRPEITAEAESADAVAVTVGGSRYRLTSNESR